MSSSTLIRLGGLAAMVSGALYVVAELLDLPDGVGWRDYYGLLPGGGSLFYNTLLVGAMAATLAIAALYALRRERRDGIVGVLVSVVAFFGLALMLWGELGEVVAMVLGALVGSVGVFALGLVSLNSRVLPWWGGVALIVWCPAYIFWVTGFLVPLLGEMLAAVSWIVAGFGVFLAAGRRTEQASRVR